MEKQNKIAINLYAYHPSKNDEYKILPDRISKYNYIESYKTANLLYLENDKKTHGHFIAIKSISRLIGKHQTHKKRLCYKCLYCFRSDEKLKSHINNCESNEFQTSKTPPDFNHLFENPVLKFKNYRNRLKQGFTAYADFESLLVPTENRTKKSKIEEQDGSIVSYSKPTQQHIPFAWD